MLSTIQARRWLDRWDDQQGYYIPDREERFTVIGDVVEHASQGEKPLIVDLGIGPGSLAVRLLDRLPGASVIGVDADRLLLGLGRRAYADRAGLRLIEHDLREPDWPAALGLERAADAVVSTTALHWLYRPALAAVYAAAAEALRPGGVLVNGDHLYDRPVRPDLDRLCSYVAERRAERARPSAEAPPEDWTTWWESALAAPELGDLAAERAEAGFTHSSDPDVSVDTHLELLTEAGFAEAGTVWQHGDDRVLVGIR